MREYFEEPKFEVVSFDVEDVITTSGDIVDAGGEGEEVE